MLHGIIISSTSGIVLFHKEFVNSLTKSKQLGGVITAMLKFSHQKVGLPVSYIQLSHLGVSISSSVDSRVSCAVFHDADDGAEFGSLLSRELLGAFIRTFQSELHAPAVVASNSIQAAAQAASASSSSSAASSGPTTGIFAMDSFLEFQSKIADIIRNAVKPLLDQLQEQRGIALVLLSSNSSHNDHDGHPSSALQYSTQEVDKLAVLANHQALMGVAMDIMGAENDTANSVILRSRRTTLILLRVERSSLIVVFKNSVDATVCLAKIEKTAEIVRKVLVMASNLKT